MVDLRDPDKPAGWVEIIDSKPVRNDGVELKPAEENPWYVLMTIAGEYGDKPHHEIDKDLIVQNRRYWNGWACNDVSDEKRAEIAKQTGLDAKDLRPLTKTEQAKIMAAFKTRLGHEKVPEPSSSIDLAEIHFSNTVVLEKWIFTGSAFFHSATFTGSANFHSATFTGSAFFHSATFTGSANFHSATFTRYAFFHSATFTRYAFFHSATFTGSANFHSATFTESADFRSATFTGPADFESATFTESADFHSATFTGPAYFRSATFTVSADFLDGKFGSTTTFRDTHFTRYVPQFYDRTFHGNTDFSTSRESWPPIADGDKATAREAKRAYTRLAQVMSELHKPDDEQFFRRQEMRCKAVEEDGLHRGMYRTYELVSDFGYSVLRPCIALALTVVFAWPFIASYLQHRELNPVQGAQAIWQGLGASFSNTFAIFRFGNVYYGADFFQKLHPLIKLLGATQTILGVVFLFFLGLGLRNRFRLK